MRCFPLRRAPFFGALLLATFLAADTATAQQRFALNTGDSSSASTAVLGDGRLSIIDAQGNRFEYERRRLQDSLDRRYLAYYSDEARQYIRFPVAGEGAMYIGSRRGIGVSWRRSQMTVQPVAGAQSTSRRVISAAAPPSLPTQFGVLAGPNNQFTLASVDESGVLQYYQSSGDSWRHGESTVRGVFPPGTPLALATRGDARAAAYGVNARGELVEISGGQAKTISGVAAPRFSPGTQLGQWTERGATLLFAVDDAGAVWQIDPDAGRFSPVESRGGFFEPGVPVAAVGGAGSLFLVDRTGNLIGYSLRGGAWSRPYRIASGFLSGGAISAEQVARAGRSPSVQVAVADAGGRLRLLENADGQWSEQNIGDVYLPPGAPVAMTAAEDGMHLSAVGADGQWSEWYQTGDRWSSRPIASGFPAGAQVVLHPAGPQAFAIDRTGRIVAGRWRDRRWQCALCSPEYGLSPLLEKRNIIPNPPLAPAEVVLENTHDEELVARIFDVRQPKRPTEVRIPAGGRVTHRFERDAGATLEEVNLLAAPGGQLVEDVNRYPLPPQQYYNVAVYANRVTSVYYDATKGRDLPPEEVNRSLVSLGVFPIPPGEQVQSGERLDVHREAILRRNPGAVSNFETPGIPPR
ncbi:MAG: hypothetical protein RIC55_15285 [Pirellulaceae bacterium]